MPSDRARKLSGWLDVLTAGLLPVVLLILPGYLAWRDAADGRRETVDEVRRNRDETIRNRAIGFDVIARLERIEQRLPPPPATQP